MNVLEVVTVAVGVILTVAFVYKLNDVRKDPSNLGAWAVLVLLLALAIATTIRDGAPGILGTIGTDTSGVLFRNLAQVTGFAGLQLWHLRNVPHVSRRRLVLELVLFVVVVVLMIVSTMSLPYGVGLTASTANLSSFAVVFFYYVAGGYVIYCLASQLRWNVVFVRTFRQRILRASAALAAVGQAFLLCAQLSRQVGQSISFFSNTPRPEPTFFAELVAVAVGFPVLVVGLLLPPIVGFVQGVRRTVGHLRNLRSLRALHTAFMWAYPDLQSPSRTGMTAASLDLLRFLVSPARSLRLASMERAQQCRDGHSRLRSNGGDGGERERRLSHLLERLGGGQAYAQPRGEEEHLQYLRGISSALRNAGGYRKALGTS